MEHIIQFGVTIDDDAIQKQVLESSVRTFTNNMEQEVKAKVKDAVFNTRFGEKNFSYAFAELVTAFLENNKDEILSMAAKNVADTIKRSKKYKAVLQAMEDAAND